MISGIIYREEDGLVVSEIHGPAETVGIQYPPNGYAYVEVLGNLGQYYDAVTGVVSDAAPVVAPSAG
jgi:hypothetical protein